MSRAPSEPPTHVGFLLLRNFSMIAFANALETYRMANYVSRRTLYTWSLVTADDEPVQGSNGLMMSPTLASTEVQRCQVLFTCGGIGVRAATDERTRRLLRHCAGQRMALGALCTGSFALASAGVLDGYRCAIHWENLAAIREEFPKVLFSQEVFTIDRDRYTCSGGIAPLDMVLHLVRAKHCAKLVRDVSEQFIVDRRRAVGDRQRMPMPECVGPGYEHFSEAVEIMSANIEEPLPLQDVANTISISLRQLERLFHKYLSLSPAQYYMNLRLRRARDLLMHSTVPIMQVTIACGFHSASHFCKSYRALFGHPPSEERRLHLDNKGSMPPPAQRVA